MSRVVVKICGVTNEADALLCVGLGADALGFVFAPSPRQVTVSTAREIAHRIPREVLTVGVFRDEARQRVVQLANDAGLGAVQLHGHETAEDCRWIAERVPRTIRAFSAGDPAVSRFPEFGADYLLIDGASPGSGEVFDWRLAEGVVDPTRMLVSGGLHADNVGAAIERLRPWGVDVSSGVESEPGRKDPHKVREFIAACREAGRALGEAGSRAGGPDAEDAEDAEDADDGELEGADQPYDWMSG